MELFHTAQFERVANWALGPQMGNRPASASLQLRAFVTRDVLVLRHFRAITVESR